MGWSALGAVISAGMLASLVASQPDQAPIPPAVQKPAPQAAMPVASRAERTGLSGDAEAREPPRPPPAPAPDLSALHAAMRDANPYAAYAAMERAHQPGSFGLAWSLNGTCHDALYAAAMAEFKARGGGGTPMPLSLERQQAISEVRSRCSALNKSRREHEPSADDANGLLFQAALGRLNPRAPFQEREWKTLAEQGGLPLVNWYLAAGPDTAPRFFEGQRVGDDAQSQKVYNAALGIASLYATVGSGGSQRDLGQLIGCLEAQQCHASRPEEWLLADWPADAPERARVMALYPRMLAAITRGDAMAFAPPKTGDKPVRP